MSATISPDVLPLLKRFRFRREKNVAALILKIDVHNLTIEHDTTLDDATLEDISDALPDSAPRYVLLSYVLELNDGRVTYPLVLMFYSPEAARPDWKMIYSASIATVADAAGTRGKMLELRDAEDLTDEWMRGELHGSH
ncbi:hypothetical protein GGF32_009901 [Allomyces javanicus]|nr:hypothetical protein GGF32_009901 [Allomyces javanicus]